jgi:hypothetical protein
MSATGRIEVGGERPYRIHVGPGLLDDGAALAAPGGGRPGRRGWGGDGAPP